MASSTRDVARLRAIELIKKKYGSLADLPESLVPVIWVTVFRSMEISITVERAGGPSAIMKSMLVDGGKLAQDFEMATQRLKLLSDFVPVIRADSSESSRLDGANYVVDMLKWGITDAGSMSAARRLIARSLAKADREYDQPFPRDLLS